MAKPEINIDLDKTGIFMRVEDLDDVDELGSNDISIEPWDSSDPFKFLTQLERFMALNLKCYKVALRKSQEMAKILGVEDDPAYDRRIKKVMGHEEKLRMMAKLTKDLSDTVGSDD